MLLLKQPAVAVATGPNQQYVDLGVIGINDDPQTSDDARTVEHKLNDGSYKIDVTGREPTRWTLTGNCITRREPRATADGRVNIYPQDELAALSRLVGRWVEVSYYDNVTALRLNAPYSVDPGLALIKSVKSTGKIVMNDQLLYTIWTCELIFADSHNLPTASEYSETNWLEQNANGKLPPLTAAARTAITTPSTGGGGGGGGGTTRPMALSFSPPPAETATVGGAGRRVFPPATGGTAPYTYTLLTNVAGIDGLDYDANARAVIWYPRLPATRYAVQVRATDSATPPAMVTATFNLTITPPAVDLAWPEDFPLNAIIRWNQRTRNTDTVSLPRAMGGVAPYTYSLPVNPASTTIRVNSRTGEVFSEVGIVFGSYSLTFRATDSVGAMIDYDFTINVT